MKLKTLVPALLFGVCAGLNAQNGAGINLSLWKNVSTQRLDSTKVTYVNLGLVSVMNRLNGVGVNVIGGAVQRDMNGIQLAGFTNLVGEGMHGVQLSGIANINGNDGAGLSATGLVNITGNNFYGANLAGFMNIAGNGGAGVTAGGLVNIFGDGYSGIALAGLASVAGDSYKGIMASGLLNLVGGDIKGMQISALCNFAADSLSGVQIGALNYATTGSGLQIGLFNFRYKNFKGVQLGLVNANPDTRVQMMIFGGNTTKFNLAARFRNKLCYTILGGGTNYLDFDQKFSAALFYRCGMWFNLYKRLNISGDLGYQHIETFKNHNYGFPARLYALQARLNLEYQISKKFAVMASGGYGASRYYNKNMTFDKGAIVEAGIVLF